MTAIHPHTTDTTADASVDQPTTLARRVLATLRIAFGLTFLWAFLDKTFALGFHTGYDEAGHLDRFGDAPGSTAPAPPRASWPSARTVPSRGSTTASPAPPWSTAFMLGLLGIGLSLTFGVAMRLGVIAGATMYVLM